MNKELEYNVNKNCKNIPNGYIIKLVEDKDGILIPQLVKEDIETLKKEDNQLLAVMTGEYKEEDYSPEKIGIKCEMTALEAFKRFKDNIRWIEENTSLKTYFEISDLHFKEDLDIIESTIKQSEKDKKVLKILKERKVDLEFLIACLNFPLVKPNDYKDISEEKQLELYNTIIKETMYIPDESRYLNMDEFISLKEYLR